MSPPLGAGRDRHEHSRRDLPGDEVTSLTLRITPLIWIVRTAVEPQVLLGPAAQRLQQVAGLPVSGVRTLRATVADSLSDADFSLLLALTSVRWPSCWPPPAYTG